MDDDINQTEIGQNNQELDGQSANGPQDEQPQGQQHAEQTTETVEHDGSDVPADAAPLTRALLDSLTDGVDAKKPGEDAQNSETSDLTAEHEEQAGKAGEQVDATNDAALSPDQEEAELLAGVKSERGRERIKAVFAQKKELEQDVNEFREIIQKTGMSPTDFAASLEFGRLVSSNSEKDLNVALQMLEQQRTQLLTRLGKEAPGFDPLADFPDLAEAVEQVEITRERAIELAKLRRREAQGQQQQQAEHAQQQDMQKFQKELQSVGATMQSFFESRMNEVDHAPRWSAIENHFKDPKNINKFVEKYRPDQWLDVLQVMYDGVALPPQKPQIRNQPLRSRPANLGAPAATGASPIERVAARLDALNI